VSEGLLGFIYLGFIFSRGSIYLLRIYWDLLAVSVFQPTHTHTLPQPLALTLTLTKPSPSLSGGIMWDYFKIFEDLLKNPNKSQKNKSW
jgi:hypothetical protein